MHPSIVGCEQKLVRGSADIELGSQLLSHACVLTTSYLVRWKSVAMYSPARSNEVASGMKPDQSKQLKIGQRVAWHDSLTDQGTITASDWSGVRIAWDNGKTQFFTTTT